MKVNYADYMCTRVKLSTNSAMIFESEQGDAAAKLLIIATSITVQVNLSSC